MDWPKSLVEEIANQRAVLFLGSGVSATSVNSSGDRPKTWGEFLSSALDLVRNSSIKSEIATLVGEKKYLVALQAIYKYSDTSEYLHLLDTNFNDPTFEPSDLHKVIHLLDVPIVITTNFDKIYDSYCNSYSGGAGYKVMTYRSKDLADAIRSSARVIIQAHGSINSPTEMIFTRQQYHEAKRDFPNFYSLLQAIFLTKTCVFVGCGMDDPDLMLVLEEVKITGASTKPHYVLIREGEYCRHTREYWKNSHNIATLEYGPNYSDLTIQMQALSEEVEAERSPL